MRIANLCAWAMAGIMTLSGGFAVAAEAVAGRPVDKGVNFQRAVTEVARDVLWLDNFLLIITGAITIFVTVLLLIVIFRFNEKANPKPAAFTHNAVLEVVWTAVPVLILVVIAIPSLRLLFLQLEVPEPDLTIKATGNQWYWSYEYPDAEIEFDSVMVAGGFSTWEDVMADEAAKAEAEKYGVTRESWLLETDNRVVVPVNAVVNVLVTASDVIHAWAMPSFGSKIDAVPGRLNETWFRAEETGVFYGQCSELCGLNHSYMPIVVEVMSQPDYDAWVQTRQALNDNGPASEPTRLAAAE
jgi:cytochrome c oxidase subunit 2